MRLWPLASPILFDMLSLFLHIRANMSHWIANVIGRKRKLSAQEEGYRINL